MKRTEISWQDQLNKTTTKCDLLDFLNYLLALTSQVNLTIVLFFFSILKISQAAGSTLAGSSLGYKTNN